MSDFSPTVVTQGNLGAFVDVLRDATGAVVDLTGAAVAFTFQCVEDLSVSFTGAATVTDAPAGKVRYQTVSGQTVRAGNYQGQWTVTFADTSVVVYPVAAADATASLATVTFSIAAKLPVVAAAQTTLLTDLYELVRAVLGDHDPRFPRYEDGSLDNVLRTLVRTGRINPPIGSVVYGLTPDRRAIAPAVANAKDLALLTYYSAETFLMPEAAAYRYRTRALGESFGEQRLFVQQLQNLIWDMENDGGVFRTFQSFYAWVNAVTGLNVWCVMTDMNVNAPVATVTVGRAGVQVNRT